jgi:hypothetical protein
MTDAQMLQNLLAIYKNMVVVRLVHNMSRGAWLTEMKEVIAELRRRIALEEDQT